jgi:hypothetical protein
LKIECADVGARSPRPIASALIIVSAIGQKNVRQKNKECVCLLHFSVSDFSVWLVSAPETTTEAISSIADPGGKKGAHRLDCVTAFNFQKPSSWTSNISWIEARY